MRTEKKLKKSEHARRCVTVSSTIVLTLSEADGGRCGREVFPPNVLVISRLFDSRVPPSGRRSTISLSTSAVAASPTTVACRVACVAGRSRPARPRPTHRTCLCYAVSGEPGHWTTASLWHSQIHRQLSQCLAVNAFEVHVSVSHVAFDRMSIAAVTPHACMQRGKGMGVLRRQGLTLRLDACISVRVRASSLTLRA